MPCGRAPLWLSSGDVSQRGGLLGRERSCTTTLCCTVISYSHLGGKVYPMGCEVQMCLELIPMCQPGEALPHFHGKNSQGTGSSRWRSGFYKDRSGWCRGGWVCRADSGRVSLVARLAGGLA